MSNTTRLVMSKRAFFVTQDAKNVAATVGQKLKLLCQPTTQSIPEPNVTHFSWRAGSNNWPLGRRVQIDDSGMHVDIGFRNTLSQTFTLSLHLQCNLLGQRSNVNRPCQCFMYENTNIFLVRVLCQNAGPLQICNQLTG